MEEKKINIQAVNDNYYTYYPRKIEYISVIAFLLSSGSVVLLDIKYTIIYLLISFFLFIKTGGFKKPNIKDVISLVIMSFWVYFTTNIIYTPVDNYYLLYIIYPFANYFFISSISFGIFKKILYKIIVYLLVISIAVHFLYFFSLISAEIYDTKTIALGLFNVHNGDAPFSTPFGPYYRFSSIYWEPGQLGCVLLFVLVLYTNEIIEGLSNPVLLIKKYGVIILSIILSCSTTTYLCFMLYIISIVLYHKNNNHFLSKILPVLFIIPISYYILSSEVVSGKFDQRNEVKDTSYSIRMQDNIVCLNLTIENPFLGKGINTKEQNRYFFKYDNRTSSNGWLFASASFGIIYLLFQISLMLNGIKRMNFNINALILLLILIFQQCNEAAIYLPYVYMYIFHFKNYDF